MKTIIPDPSKTIHKPFLKRFWALGLPYWTSEEKWSAFGLLAVVMAMNLGMVYVQVRVNEWSKGFYNALQALDKAAFSRDLVEFAWLATAYIVQAVYMLYLNQMLQIRWRRWLTDRYLDQWLSGHNYYRMQFLEHPVDNPDQRISEDIKSLVEITLTLGVTLLSSIATLISFVLILWELSGTLTLPIGSLGTFRIPGYMVWAAVAYSFLGTWLTMRVGNPLIMLNFNQQRFEADFRFSMVRLRENREAIALYGGEGREAVTFARRFKEVVSNYWQIMKRQKRLTWLTSGYGQIAIIFPVLMAAPRFFSKEMELGGLMQTVGAFGAVHGALSYLVTSYPTIATWHAVIDRLTGFAEAVGDLETLKARETIVREPSPDASFEVQSLSVILPDDRVLVSDATLSLNPGTSLLISGPSGSGKSTFMRALAGIWPYGKGTIRFPARANIMFLPQKPYLPLGTLREALHYPLPPDRSDEEIQNVLALCGLKHLKDHLDHEADWSHSLSLGEQQKVAMARVLLRRPDYLFLDEATASLDEAMEGEMYRLIRTYLPNAVVASVGHRSTLLGWHQSLLTFTGDGQWRISSLNGNQARQTSGLSEGPR